MLYIYAQQYQNKLFERVCIVFISLNLIRIIISFDGFRLKFISLLIYKKIEIDNIKFKRDYARMRAAMTSICCVNT